MFVCAEAKAKEAKQGWFSWLGWGKSKAAEARDEAQRLAEDLKRRGGEAEDAFVKRFEEARAKAQAKGEEVRQRAGETEEQYRVRIAKAISRKD
ncbi:hypothetical protein OF83DRAFT_1063807 [Amylostereum chailletii]|nr:hypothetical protein OF83DRAFT_1063807 [Amylostereum chailletii]